MSEGGTPPPEKRPRKNASKKSPFRKDGTRKDEFFGPPNGWHSRDDMCEIIQIAATTISKSERERLDFPIPTKDIIQEVMGSTQSKLARYVRDYGSRTGVLFESKRAHAVDSDNRSPMNWYPPNVAACIVQGVIERLMVSRGKPNAPSFKSATYDKVLAQMPTTTPSERAQRALFAEQRTAWVTEALVMTQNIKIKTPKDS